MSGGMVHQDAGPLGRPQEGVWLMTSMVSSRLLWVLSGAFLFPMAARAEETGAGSSPVEWLKENAVKVRSVDPSDEDFSDLLPLKEIIGNARVVQLGEPSHGDGTAFEAKVRLVKFLHQEMGFDVLAWESGFYDCWQMNRALRRKLSPAEVADRGVFSLWSQCRQVMPLFEYALKSQASPFPLEMAGFDCQPTSSHSGESWRDDCKGLRARLGRAWGGDEEWKVLTDYPEKASSNVYAGDPEARSLFSKTATSLQEHLAGGAADGVTALSSRECRFWWRTLENAKAYLSMVEAQGSAPGQEGMKKMISVRERCLEETLLWMVREGYQDRKIITWGAFGHFLHGGDAIRPNNPAFRAMGEKVHEELADSVYTIGFITYEGEAGRVGSRSFPLPAAPEGSFEALCHAVGGESLFLDFRHNRDKAPWLKEKRVARPNGYRPATADWTGVCDGFFFTDSMIPAEQLSQEEG